MCYRNPRTDTVPTGRKRCSRCECDYNPTPVFFHANAGKNDGLDGWVQNMREFAIARYAQMTRHRPQPTIDNLPEANPQPEPRPIVDDADERRRKADAYAIRMGWMRAP